MLNSVSIFISFGRNSAGALEITDANDYYPFGMNHLKTGNAFYGQGSYKNYKYNGKELQESGMYAMDWRNYMPDIGRFTGMDALSEAYESQTPYHFALNNPANYSDPTGMYTRDANGNITTSDRGEIDSFMSYLGAGGSVAGVNNLVNNNAAFSLELPEVTINARGNSRTWNNSANLGYNRQLMYSQLKGVMGVAGVISLPTGGGASAGTWTAIRGILGELAGGLRAGLWSLPLLLEGDMQKKEQEITLYRGVYREHPDYKNALKGQAWPYDLNGHKSPEAHNGGNYKSIFTSWTRSPAVANYHANKNGSSGVVLKKTFPILSTVPSPDAYDEMEVLVPGIVKGATVTSPTGPGFPRAY